MSMPIYVIFKQCLSCLWSVKLITEKINSFNYKEFVLQFQVVSREPSRDWYFILVKSLDYATLALQLLKRQIFIEYKPIVKIQVSGP